MAALKKFTNYFKEAYAEMRKVVWPTKKQTISYSIIVIALTLGVAIFFGVLDYIFNIGLELIIQ
jgi:preprotein translocase subunit SecE